MEETSFTANVRGVSDLVESGVNKITSSGNYNPEGVEGEKIDVLSLPMSDEELLKLRDEWESRYAPYESRILPIFKRNLLSYLGRRPDNSLPSDTDVVAANLQFEAEETFLPAALAEDPAPFVYSDNSPEGNAISEAVQTMLQFHADQLLLRRKLGVMVRQWSIYQLGVLKPGWNGAINDVALDNRKIQDFVFDPDGYVDVHGDFSSWIGERITVTAEKLAELFPDDAGYICLLVENKMGTECVYTEWWNDDYCFKTFKDKVLEKHRNEYFNYEEEGEPDEFGMPTMTTPRNHFAVPKKPYIFLSVYSLQERPHDITGLIEQNIPNQNLVTHRTIQIDDNLSQSNNGLAFSENNFNQETAKQASNALTRGVGKVLVPQGGPIGEAIVRIQAPGLPGGFFDDLENNKNMLKSSWGTQGISSQPPQKDVTARGMILNQSHDTSRIGGGIGDVIEQSVARSVFNWLVQLYMVFYDEEHFGAVMGVGKAVEYKTLSAQSIDRQLIVGVTPNSMKPKDAVSKMNQAQNLFQIGAIGPKILLETLDFPNPDQAAADGVLYKLDPMSYMKLNFPEEAQKLEQMAMQQAQAQMAAQAGMVGSPGTSPPQGPQLAPPPMDTASAQLAQTPVPQV